MTETLSCPSGSSGIAIAQFGDLGAQALRIAPFGSTIGSTFASASWADDKDVLNSSAFFTGGRLNFIFALDGAISLAATSGDAQVGIQAAFLDSVNGAPFVYALNYIDDAIARYPGGSSSGPYSKLLTTTSIPFNSGDQLNFTLVLGIQAALAAGGLADGDFAHTLQLSEVTYTDGQGHQPTGIFLIDGSGNSIPLNVDLLTTPEPQSWCLCIGVIVVMLALTKYKHIEPALEKSQCLRGSAEHLR